MVISKQFERGCAMTLGCGLGDNVCGPTDEGALAAAGTPQTASASLVLGFGNVLLSDDGAGVQLVERLRTELGPCGAQFVDAGTLSFSLLSYIEATDSMLVIDAANIDAAPGAVGLFEGAAMDEFLISARRRTVHEVGLIDLLDMARLQNCLPRRRALLCIQPGRIDWSEALSAPVAESLPAASRLAKALLQRWRLA
jgi:hydrogenase maturation protease